MGYVASQIIIWMLLAAVFGFAIGYFARGRRTKGRKRRLPTAGRR
jgi:hypothetical protein